MSPAPRLLVTAVAGLLAVASLNARAQVRYIDGLFVATKDSVTELIAYAEQTSNGQLRMQGGSLEDAPVVHEITRIMSSIPQWQPAGVIVATTSIFRDERAERRRLAISGRKLNIYAVELRVADLERRSKIDALLKSVNASTDTPGYAFIVMVSEYYRRFYPIRLTPAER